jgi:hypothetical protein
MPARLVAKSAEQHMLRVIDGDPMARPGWYTTRPGRACYSAWASVPWRSCRVLCLFCKEGEFYLWLSVDRAACAKGTRFT